MTTVRRFTQETCGACTTQRELDDGIEDRFPDVAFREVDIRTDLETADAYGVRKTPTTLVLVDGERVAEFVGVVERPDLEAAIRDAQTARTGLAARVLDLVRS